MPRSSKRMIVVQVVLNTLQIRAERTISTVTSAKDHHELSQAPILLSLIFNWNAHSVLVSEAFRCRSFQPLCPPKCRIKFYRNNLPQLLVFDSTHKEHYCLLWFYQILIETLLHWEDTSYSTAVSVSGPLNRSFTSLVNLSALKKHHNGPVILTPHPHPTPTPPPGIYAIANTGYI